MPASPQEHADFGRRFRYCARGSLDDVFRSDVVAACPTSVAAGIGFADPVTV
jgi:hypothetical protein